MKTQMKTKKIGNFVKKTATPWLKYQLQGGKLIGVTRSKAGINVAFATKNHGNLAVVLPPAHQGAILARGWA